MGFSHTKISLYQYCEVEFNSQTLLVKYKDWTKIFDAT